MSGNFFANVPAQLPQELVETVLAAESVRIDRIVSLGHTSPEDFWYDQPDNEWVLLLQGEARVQFEDRTAHLKPGDHLNISAHERHRVEWTSPHEPTIWLAVFYR